MSGARPVPGPGQITVSAAGGQPVCCNREHQALGKLAEVLVTFGQLGTPHVDALWPETWGHTFPMCGGCWQITCTIATARRPHLTVTDTRPQPRRRAQKVASDRPA